MIIFHYDEHKQYVFIAMIYDHDGFSIYSHTVLTLLAQFADYKDIDSELALGSTIFMLST